MEDRKCLKEIVLGPSWKNHVLTHWTCSRMEDTPLTAEGELGIHELGIGLRSPAYNLTALIPAIQGGLFKLWESS